MGSRFVLMSGRLDEIISMTKSLNDRESLIGEIHWLISSERPLTIEVHDIIANQ